MRIASTIFFTATFLGATINAGWCPQPANLGAPLGASTGSTGVAVNRPPGPKTYSPGEDKRDPRNMTQSERLRMVGREQLAGRITNEQERKNFIQTGDPHLSYTPPPERTFVKPPGMPDATWQRLQAHRAPTPNYVSGTYTVPGSGRSLEENAARAGGTLTRTPTTTTATTPSKPTSTGTAALEQPRFNTVTKLGVHPTPAPPPSPVVGNKPVVR